MRLLNTRQDDTGDGIDGIEKVVGMAATPPQNPAPIANSLFEVKSCVVLSLKQEGNDQS